MSIYVSGVYYSGGQGAAPTVSIRYTTLAALPDPDTLPEGTVVSMTDESTFVGMVAKRPHLEADGSQRKYYVQLQTAGFSWKHIAGSNTTASYLGRYDPADGKVYAITSTSDVPNCVLGSSVSTGALCTAQRVGKPLSSYLAAGQTLVSGQPLTWNASGQLIAWTTLSPTHPVGFIAIGTGFLPMSAGSLGVNFTSYLPFVTPG